MMRLLRLGRNATLRYARPALYRVLESLVRDEETLDWLLHRLSNRFAMGEATFDKAPADLERIRGFQDCCWLFSSNKLNRGLVRHTFNEAPFIYNIVESKGSPRADLFSHSNVP